jgi:hypothetical protein
MANPKGNTPVPDITITVTDKVAERLAVLVDPDTGLAAVEDVVGELVDHAQQGVYRPGAWERSWLMQAFGDDWLDRVEPDTNDTAADGRIIFDRPRQ